MSPLFRAGSRSHTLVRVMSDKRSLPAEIVLVGTRYYEAFLMKEQGVLKRGATGALVREPDNAHDENATHFDLEDRPLRRSPDSFHSCVSASTTHLLVRHHRRYLLPGGSSSDNYAGKPAVLVFVDQPSCVRALRVSSRTGNPELLGSA